MATNGGGSISFIAQINLAEVQQVWPGNPPPPLGLLTFFYEADEQPWGRDGELPEGSLLVAHFEGDDLVRTPAPADLRKKYIFRERAVRMQPTVTLGSSFELDRLQVSPLQIYEYSDLYQSLHPNHGNHQLLGYGFALQVPPSYSCPSRDYELLLQVTSDYDFAQVTCCGAVVGFFSL